MMLDQPFLGKGPESLNPIDVHLSLFELVPVIDVEMLVATEHEGIVSCPSVGVNDGSSPYPLHRLRHETLR